MLNYQEPTLPNIIDYSKDDWKIKVNYDEITDSPRSWDNLGQICVSNNCRYFKNEYEYNNELSWSDRKSDLKQLEKEGFIVLPLSVYDHSGVSIYIGSPCDRWDSGQVGWYIASKEFIRKEFGVKRISPKLREKVESIMKDEVETYNKYYNGEIYSFTLYHNGDEVDSCSGFYDIKDMYDYFPSEFRSSFTVEQMEKMVEMAF